MDIRKKELYEVFADSLEKSRTKEGGLLFDKLFEDMWEHIEPKLGQSLLIDSVSQQRELLIAYELSKIEHPNIREKEVANQKVEKYISNL